jgi:hypothetical protein
MLNLLININHKIKFFVYLSRPKDNNVNSIIVTVNLFGPNGPVSMDKSHLNRILSKPIGIYFNYLNVIFN